MKWVRAANALQQGSVKRHGDDVDCATGQLDRLALLVDRLVARQQGTVAAEPRDWEQRQPIHLPTDVRKMSASNRSLEVPALHAVIADDVAAVEVVPARRTGIDESRVTWDAHVDGVGRLFVHLSRCSGVNALAMVTTSSQVGVGAVMSVASKEDVLLRPSNDENQTASR